jgi:hypothetical protein
MKEQKGKKEQTTKANSIVADYEYGKNHKSYVLYACINMAYNQLYEVLHVPCQPPFTNHAWKEIL